MAARRHSNSIRVLCSALFMLARPAIFESPAQDDTPVKIAPSVQDYRRVKDRMVHRFAHGDGSGYTWTNDRDSTQIVWLLQDAPLPDGRRGKAGQVYEIP